MELFRARIFGQRKAGTEPVIHEKITWIQYDPQKLTAFLLGYAGFRVTIEGVYGIEPKRSPEKWPDVCLNTFHISEHTTVLEAVEGKSWTVEVKTNSVGQIYLYVLIT